MRAMHRNCSDLEYRKYLGKEEILVDGKHTGRYQVKYGDPEPIRGNINVPSGYAQHQFFGINLDYTHVLVTDNPDFEMTEAGRIDWKGNSYEILSVKPSPNVLSVALKKLTKSQG